jgi:hypothetical protein
MITVEWLILAEGIGQDAKGAFTVIGINQNVLVASALPALTKRALMAHVVDDGDSLKKGHEASAKFKVIAPSGEVVAEVLAKFEVGERRLKDLPAELDIPAELGLEIKEFGAYRLRAEVTTPSGKFAAKELSLYVVEPSAFRAEESPADSGDQGS